MKYKTTSFITEYLVSGILPSVLLQTTKSAKIFKRIFTNSKNLSQKYAKAKRDAIKENQMLFLFNFKHAFISYCTARNDEECEKSARYFMLFLQTYSTDFILAKLKFSLIRFLSLTLCCLGLSTLASDFVPNYLHIPHYTAIHFIAGGILGYAMYKIIFSQSIMNREIIWTLRFLQEKTLPLSKKLKG
jgi:hypothetical protein